jgi:hypothetical protein
MSRTSFSLAIAMALSLPMAAAAIAAELVVIDSNAPDLKKGSVVDSAAEISLPAGTRATLMSASGEKVRLTGPFSGKVPASAKAGDPKLVTAVARLLDPQAKDTTALGAFRGAKAVSTPAPDAIDAAKGGNFCVLQNTKVKLRRGTPPATADWGKLTAIKEGTEAEVTWAADVATADWPSQIPISDGGRYMLARSKSQPVRVVLYLEPKGLQLAGRLEWMQERGCKEQALALLEQMP